MEVNRTIPPTAAPIYLIDLIHGLISIFSGKRYIQRLEKEIKAHFGVKHVFLVSSGKASLFLILKALESLMNDKKYVLIPAYTCFSVPSAIVKAGLKVALCDINPSTFDFDYNLLKNAIDKDTLCIMPNHLFGIPSDMERIKDICRDKNIFIIEDAAQAMGGSYKGKKIGILGDVGFFSLGRGKNITCGSGGIIITNSDQIASAITKQYSNLEYHGIIEDLKEFLKLLLMAIFIRPALYWFPAGLPFLKLGENIFYKNFPIKRLSGMKAGFLKNWQKRLEESNQIRKENTKYFNEGLGLKSRLSNGNAVSLLRFPLTVDSKEIRDNLFFLSNKKGLGLSLMYPTPINEIKELYGAFNGQSFPSAKNVSERLLTIPTHHLLSEKDKERISNIFQ